jgi:tRNA (guanosine-2'-O-)-methyltransferase
MTELSLITYLEQFVQERRKELIRTISEKRTRYITVVMEDIYQSQNASAVLRTCDCFGIQDVHIIENRNKYQLNPDVTKGSDKWIKMIKYRGAGNNSIKAISELKNAGYRIVATTPNHQSVNLEDFDLYKGKAAIFFGNERNGLSEEIINNADENLKIPMHGFTESLNISVSASIILHTLTNKLHSSLINWQLTREDIAELKLKWLKKSIKHADLLEKRYHQEKERQGF